MREFRLVSTSGICGYGFPEETLKAAMARRIPAGDLGDTDVYGAQQRAPLLAVDIPV